MFVIFKRGHLHRSPLQSLSWVSDSPGRVACCSARAFSQYTDPILVWCLLATPHSQKGQRRSYGFWYVLTHSVLQWPCCVIWSFGRYYIKGKLLYSRGRFNNLLKRTLDISQTFCTNSDRSICLDLSFLHSIEDNQNDSGDFMSQSINWKNRVRWDDLPTRSRNEIQENLPDDGFNIKKVCSKGSNPPKNHSSFLLSP